MSDKIYSFDASSIIYFWDNYPVDNSHFDSIWSWFSKKISQGIFTISKEAFDECIQKADGFKKWLSDNNIEFNIYKKNKEDLKIASEIEKFLEIKDKKYHSKGVGENDIFIISIAKRTDTTLVSNEGKQNNEPEIKANFKIPLVCEKFDVECINFTELLKKNIE